ncbi:MAG: hypothetical protein KTR14_04990 [Vampirovibrio sp.]|nr:hypothetical protein [Vampirovibrio sp.]
MVSKTIREVQQEAWISVAEPPQTTRQGLEALQQKVAKCLEQLQDEQLPQCQSSLEDALLQTLVAMKTMNLDADRGFERAVARQQVTSLRQRAFHVYPDRVEIWAGAEIRGGWPLYTPEDVEAVVTLASQFECEVVYRDTKQMPLFAKPSFTGQSNTSHQKEISHEEATTHAQSNLFLLNPAE